MQVSPEDLLIVSGIVPVIDALEHLSIGDDTDRQSIRDERVEKGDCS